MKNLKETYGDASANASLLNKLNAKKDAGNTANESKKKVISGHTELEDVVKLGN